MPSALFSDARSQRIPLQRKRIGHANGSTDRALRSAADGGDRDPNRLAVRSYRGAVYYADIQINDETFKMIVDTGSTDVWVSCHFIEKSRCQPTCPKSGTVITYGSGEVCVFRDYATLRLGRVSIENYAVGVAIGANVLPGEDSILLGDAEGLLGLGYPRLATITSPVGYLVNFMKRFSMYLTPNDSVDGSFLLINEVDERLIQQNGLVGYTVPLKRETHWTLGMTSFQFGAATTRNTNNTATTNKSTTIVPCTNPTAGSCDAIVDTGTTLVLVPQQVFRRFLDDYLLPGGCILSKEASTNGFYICPSAVVLPTLRFSFGNKNFYLEKADYIITLSQARVAIEIQPSVSSAGLSQTWVLGDTFLKKFYSSFEVGKAVVLYCKPGVSCDESTDSSSNNSTTTEISAVSVAVPSPDSSSSSSTNSSSSIFDAASSPPFQPRATTSISANNASSSIDGSGVSSSKSSGSDHQAIAVVVVAVLVGVAFIVAVVVGVRRWYSTRERRHASGNEMQPVASTDGVGAAVYAAAPHTPKTMN